MKRAPISFGPLVGVLSGALVATSMPGLGGRANAWAQNRDPPTSYAGSSVRRETLGGAYERAYDRLEIFNREFNLERENQGGQGRINATRSVVRDVECPPLAASSLTPW